MIFIKGDNRLVEVPNHRPDKVSFQKVQISIQPGTQPATPNAVEAVYEGDTVSDHRRFPRIYSDLNG